jgi:sulfide:quinone oxidoreductase
MDARRIAEGFAVAGQLQPDDMPAAAEAGYTTVINNRPDHEGGPEQPTAEACAKAAEEAGLAYHYLPMTPDQLSPELVASFHAALSQSGGPVLAHCKSGPRSLVLWGLAQVCHEGREIDAVLEEAYAQGFDISHLKPLFQAFQAQTTAG